MDDLEAAVARVVGSAAWGVDVAATTEHVRGQIGEREWAPRQIEELCLAHACCEADPAALDTLLGIVRDVVAKVLWPGVDLGDRCARVWSHTLDVDANGRTRLATFDGRGPLAAWLRVVATRLAQRERPQLETEAATEDSLAALWASAAAGAEHELIKDMYVDTVRNAFRTATSSLDENQRSLLRMHYARGVSLERLTTIYGVHRVTLSRRLAAARREILDRAVAELTRDTAMSEAECRSLLRTLRSRLDLSLGRL